VRVISFITIGVLLTLIGGGQKLNGAVDLTDKLVDLTGCTSGIHYQYYEVSGKNVQEVRRQLLEKGPVDQKGERRFAFAAWTLEWDWPVESDGTRRYLDTKVSCKAEVLLPRFRSEEGGSLYFNQTIYDAFETIKKHELHHVQHAIEGASILRRAIISAAEEGRIKKEKDANKIAFKVVDKVRSFDVTYDEMTHYGKTEGIWLR
jgi:predicted secreted Zn-dependent protease